MARHVDDDVDVVASSIRRLERTPHPLDPPLAAGHRALGFGPARGCRQHDVSKLRGLREEDVLHHEVIETGKQAHRAVLVRLGSGGVLADDVHGLHLTVLHGFEHLAQVISALGRDRGVPCLLERPPLLWILDILEAGKAVRDGAHIATTLDVVLPAQGIEAAAIAADLAGEKREVDERKHVVDSVVVLGDAERPADHRSVRSRVRERDVLDGLRRHAGVLFDPLQRVRLDGFGERVEAGRRASDELAVREPVVDDFARHPVRKRDVTADVDPEPRVRPFGRARAPWIDRDQSRSVAHSFENVVEEDRMRLARIRAPQDHEVSLFSLAIRRGSSSRSEHCRQTDDTWSVSSPVTAVDVVAVHDDAGELLRDEVHLVARLRAAEHPERVWPVVASGRESSRGALHGLVPRSWA